MEAATPTPNKHLAESEARWMRPAGIFALAGVLLVATGSFLTRSGGNADIETTAGRLRESADWGAGFIAGHAIAFFGLIALAVSLFFLFQAAAARAPKVRRGFVIFVLLGPFLFGGSLLALNFGSEQVGETYVKEFPTALPGETKDTTTKDTTTKDTTTKDTTTKDTTTSSSSGSNSGPPTSVDPKREDRANQLQDGSILIRAGGPLLIVGLFSTAFAMIYTSLWSFRTGLLTRFWGTLGMATGGALVLLGLAGIIFLLIWFAALGMMFIGFFPGGRPPAWAAGMAIPWPKPEPRGGAGRKDQPVEGSGREVEEPALPEGSKPDDPEGGSGPSTGDDSSGKPS